MYVSYIVHTKSRVECAPQTAANQNNTSNNNNDFCWPFLAFFCQGGRFGKERQKILEMCLRNSDNHTRICPQVSGRQVARYKDKNLQVKNQFD